jgi:hypothetical protein
MAAIMPKKKLPEFLDLLPQSFQRDRVPGMDDGVVEMTIIDSSLQQKPGRLEKLTCSSRNEHAVCFKLNVFQLDHPVKVLEDERILSAGACCSLGGPVMTQVDPELVGVQEAQDLVRQQAAVRRETVPKLSPSQR